jgi:hypothetical protein
MRALLFAALLLVSSPLHAADKDRIVGTWKLVSVVYEDAQTKERTPVLGEHPRLSDRNAGRTLAGAGHRRRPAGAENRRGPRQGAAYNDRL